MCNLYWATCKVGSVLIFIALINLPQCESIILKVTEGELAQLDFPYPCDSTVVKLQIGNARPFYRTANPHYMSLPSNQNLVNYNQTELNQCFLNLTINPVSRADKGNYILTAYKNSFVLKDYPSFYLVVYYPPGKAWCELKTDYKDGEWVLMQCTAPRGTVQGQIVCYQNDTRLPKWNEPTNNGENLNQEILARLHGVVYCCSSILNERRDKCECTDWGWDPISDSVFDIAEPCPEVMFTEDPTSTNSIITDLSSSNLVTAQIIYIENHKNNLNWIVICALSLVIFILIIIIMCVILMYRCTVRKLAHQKGSITQESKEPCLSVKEENIPEHHGTII